jgi:hypothetical protein
MKSSISPVSHKLGANRKEIANKKRKHDANFSQSRDIREDRGARQEKFIQRPQTTSTHLGQIDRAREKRLLLPEHVASAKRPVVVKLNHSDAKTVTVAGTFNRWHPEATPLRRVHQDEWVRELVLEVGVYEYRFVVDGQWMDDPNAQQHVSNGLGGQNSLLEVS